MTLFLVVNFDWKASRSRAIERRLTNEGLMKGFDLSQSRDDDPFPFPFRDEKKYADHTIGFYCYSAGYMIMYMSEDSRQL